MSSSRKVAGNFLQVSKALKAAGETELRKELHKGVKKAARPLIPKARAAAKTQLPQRGGLAKRVAGSPMRTQVRTGTNKYGVRLVVGKNGSGARDANRGRIRHPVFGNRDRWVDQRVPSGWFDDTMRAAAPAIRKDVQAAIDKVVNDIAKRGRA